MIDVHCHLTYKGLRERVDRVIEEAKGVLKGIVTCGFPFEASEGEEGACEEGFPSAVSSLKLAERYKGFVFVTLGLHPVQAVRMRRTEVEDYMEFIKRNSDKIVGIGEIGLDRHWIRNDRDYSWSREVFLQLLDLAEELRMPVVLHLRKAEEEGYKLVSRRSNLSNVLFHSFAGKMSVAKEVIESGYYLSLNTRIATIKNAKKLARRAPLELLLTETDAPFLSPTADPINRPINVRVVVEEIARLRKLSFEEVAAATTRNAINFFDLKL